MITKLNRVSCYFKNVVPRLRARLRLCDRSNFDVESLRGIACFGLCVPLMDVAIVTMVTVDATIGTATSSVGFPAAVAVVAVMCASS